MSSYLPPGSSSFNLSTSFSCAVPADLPIALPCCRTISQATCPQDSVFPVFLLDLQHGKLGFLFPFQHRFFFFGLFLFLRYIRKKIKLPEHHFFLRRFFIYDVKCFYVDPPDQKIPVNDFIKQRGSSSHDQL